MGLELPTFFSYHDHDVEERICGGCLRINMDRMAVLSLFSQKRNAILSQRNVLLLAGNKSEFL